MCSREQVSRNCHHAYAVRAWWWWGAFPSKRGTEGVEPSPTYLTSSANLHLLLVPGDALGVKLVLVVFYNT